ncbi:MAG: outer membrane beta-barrel protein [candidate division Zixibacteria bacterium]|nr:outer membrane beta-barrel protein [candidate division Zixibacteria bacterium]MDH3939046.1 outer membrane beta-barrel protein [candidate division Zixibacteria bacterium]MDH4033185.1 outer membrane beta-barrel protein [candidate division Zixibacteria bacterium]
MTKTVLIIALVAAIATSAMGQTPSKPFSVYLQGGASMPQQDFKDLYKYGYHGGGGLGFSIFPRMELVARGSYHKYSAESLNSILPDQSTIDVTGGDLSMIMYGAELKLNLGVFTSNPYLLGGFGRAQFDIEDVTVNAFGLEQTHEFPSHTETYRILGAGLEFTRTFLEARYYTFMEDITEETSTRLITVSFGIRL